VKDRNIPLIELYKVVRGDYTDCYSGTVRYVVGDTLVHPDRGRQLCSDGVYHACRKPEQTLKWHNSQWPLRLLKIYTPEVIAEDKGLGHEKCGVHELAVIEELPISLAFGPNGQKVVDLINRLSGIKWFEPQYEREKVKQLIEKHLSILEKFGVKQVSVKFISDWNAAWNAARNVAWDAAWNAAWNAVHIIAEDLVDFENPAEPLLQVWELGYWPIGVVNGEFLVFERRF
jgi:hypothetical protein